jgi:hypothetical protein
MILLSKVISGIIVEIKKNQKYNSIFLAVFAVFKIGLKI